MTKKRAQTASELRQQGVAHLKGGNLDHAVRALERALLIEPHSINALINLGAAQRKMGNLSRAIECYCNAIGHDPESTAAQFNLANALKETGSLDAAISAYQRVLEIEPGNLLALNNMGIAYKQTGQSELAESAFREALRLSPDYGAAIRNLAAVHEDKGEFAEAHSAYTNALAVNANDSKALAKIIASRVKAPEQQHIDAASRLLQGDQVDAEGRAQLHYGLGKRHDQVGEYVQALAHFKRANAIKTHYRRFSGSAVAKNIDAICSAFSPQLFARLAGQGLDDARPVFIVGMPRTGTTLAEQVLSSHPDIAGGGELPYFGSVALNFASTSGLTEGFPGGAHLMDASAIKSIGEPYLEELSRVSPAARRVTDKMPQNFLYLGLIALLFPHARIVHCWRDPRDVCLSCYVEDFNPAHGFASDARHFSAYYKEYCRLMAHWRRVLPLPIFDLRYEDMIASSESVSRALLNFAGCTWDDRCLHFYRQKRAVTTPSRWQVRQPIYSSSVGRWKNYPDFIEPVLDELSRAARTAPGMKKI